MSFNRWIRTTLCLCLLEAGLAHAQLIQIPPTAKGLFGSQEATSTFLFPVEQPRATLVFIPGGEGRVGMKPGWSEGSPYFSQYPFNLMLRALTNGSVTSGRTNVVIFDSPTALSTARHWSTERTWGDHLNRVEDVVNYYREKLGVPVFVMGHSMGSISVTEFAKRLENKNVENSVAGLISSSGNNAISLNYSKTRYPVLVLHHEHDQCSGNTVEAAIKFHGRLVEAGNNEAELAILSGGIAAGDPCRSGYHMYLGLGESPAKTIDQFIAKNLTR